MSQVNDLQSEPSKKLVQQPDLQELIKATRAIKKKKSETDLLFSELYPYAKEALDAGATQKDLLAEWAAKGFKLNPTKFREKFAAEAKRREELSEDGLA